MTTRAAVVDDHELLATTLALALEARGYEVHRPSMTDLDGALADLARFRPGVTLLDLDLGAVGDGRDLVAPLAAGGSRVVVLSGTEDRWRVGACLELGAVGWVRKTAALGQFLGEVEAAAQHRPVLSEPDRVRLVAEWHAHQRSHRLERARFERLTRREREVLAMLMAGETVERIATRAVVSHATVRTQVHYILMKLEVNNQLEAVALAHRVGWSADGGI